jgi:hypothetical protein
LVHGLPEALDEMLSLRTISSRSPFPSGPTAPPDSAQNLNLSYSKRNPFFSAFSLPFHLSTPLLLQRHCTFNMATNENGSQNYMVQDEDNDTVREEERI